MPREQTWLASAQDLQLLPCPMNQHGQRQPRAHRSLHAPGNNMAGSRPGHTSPAMPWEPTWPADALGPQLPPCPGNQMAAVQPRANSSNHAPGTIMAGAVPSPQLPSYPGNQHGRGQPQAHSSCLAPGTNRADREPRAHNPRHDQENKMASGSLGPTAPAMPWYQHGRQAAPCTQFTPCPENQHGHPAAPGPQLPPCDGNKHGRPGALRPQILP